MKKILLIEDERNLHKVLNDYLQGEEIEIISAFDGEEGIKKAKELKPDVVILDLVLPKIQGMDVLRELKKDEVTKHIPIIIFTNLHDFNAIQESVECGVNCYLLKSDYKIEDLLKRVKQVIK
ncbi:Response regulator ArlR [bacterium HR34]|nr:Response regulator ArlR [bacterium HR34]